MHITTQKPPKFYQELQRFFIDEQAIHSVLLAKVNQDTGLPITHPTKDLFQQITILNSRSTNKDPSSLILKPYYRLDSNIQYFQQASHTPLTAIPEIGYC